jgi:hypothetical protein
LVREWEVQGSNLGVIYFDRLVRGEHDLTSGLPDGLFSNQKIQFGKFWRALEWKMLIYFMDISNILLTFGIFSDNLVQFVFFWYIFPVLVSCTKKNLATLLDMPLDCHSQCSMSRRYVSYLIVAKSWDERERAAGVIFFLWFISSPTEPKLLRPPVITLIW